MARFTRAAPSRPRAQPNALAVKRSRAQDGPLHAGRALPTPAPSRTRSHRSSRAQDAPALAEELGGPGWRRSELARSFLAPLARSGPASSERALPTPLPAERARKRARGRKMLLASSERA